VSNIDKRALREAAERAGQNDWEYVYTSDLSAPGRGYITVGGAEAIYCLNKAAGGVKQSENVLRYIAAASPETMLALLNEIAELEQRHCGTALLEREEMHTKTLGRMLDELEAKDKSIDFLKDQLAQLANFNPDWDKLEAATDSLREHMAELTAARKRIAELDGREVVLPSTHDVHPLGPQSAKIFCEFHRSIVNRCADEIRKVGVKVSIKGN